MPKFYKYALTSLAISSLVMAVFAFFFPIQLNFISGHLDDGQLFTREWFSYSYEVVGGYLLLLAAASCAKGMAQFNKGPAGSREVLFWAGLSIILVVGVYSAGKTFLISWLPGVPVELQNALGTKYVDYRVTLVTNLPQVLSSVSVALFGLVAAITTLLGWREGK